jgi:hypothetical protein
MEGVVGRHRHPLGGMGYQGGAMAPIHLGVPACAKL